MSSGRYQRPSNGRPTLDDVAAKAGVSAMSVSRVLKNVPSVSPEIRARVNHAISELNYLPNFNARMLAEGRQSHNIAFLFGTSNAAALGEMVSGGWADALSAGVELVFMNVAPHRQPGSIRKSLESFSIHGIILSPSLGDNAGLRNALSGAGYRLVMIGSNDNNPAFSAIGFDDGRAGQLPTVDQPIGAMARWAVRQLLDELSAMERGQEPQVRKVVLPDPNQTSEIRCPVDPRTANRSSDHLRAAAGNISGQMRRFLGS